nr:unnamed protein product [Digitaria exilis]
MTVVSSRRKERMRPSHHAPYALGGTRATKGGTKGRDLFGLQAATRLHEAGIAGNQPYDGESRAPGEITHVDLRRRQHPIRFPPRISLIVAYLAHALEDVEDPDPRCRGGSRGLPTAPPVLYVALSPRRQRILSGRLRFHPVSLVACSIGSIIRSQRDRRPCGDLLAAPGRDRPPSAVAPAGSGWGFAASWKDPPLLQLAICRSTLSASFSLVRPLALWYTDKIEGESTLQLGAPRVLHEMLLRVFSFARSLIEVTSPTTRRHCASTSTPASTSPASSLPSTMRHGYMGGAPSSWPLLPLVDPRRLVFTFTDRDASIDFVPSIPTCVIHSAPVTSVFVLRFLSMEGYRSQVPSVVSFAIASSPPSTTSSTFVFDYVTSE